MLNMDNFLCCMKLETGGLVIGWFHAVCYVICFILGAIILMLFCTYDCHDLEKAIRTDGHTGMDDNTPFLCSFERGSIIAIALVVMVFSIGFFVISYLCIKGTHRRHHIHVKPMMILMGVMTVLSLLEILSMDIEGLVSALLQIPFYGYQFIVMYSLHSRFQEEFQRGLTPQYYVPRENVEKQIEHRSNNAILICNN